VLLWATKLPEQQWSQQARVGDEAAANAVVADRDPVPEHALRIGAALSRLVRSGREISGHSGCWSPRRRVGEHLGGDEALSPLGAGARLKPSQTSYVARSRGRQQLRFSKSGDPAIEAAYRTHWVSPQLSEAKRARLAERQSRPPDLVVISPVKDWSCSSCGGDGGLLIMKDAGPLCMACADMDHLVLLAAGDAALTRRAKRASRLSAVVVRFSRARGRYERQGILVEERALEEAEAKCVADEQARARRRERDASKRADEDRELQARMAAKIASLFPGCPAERAEEIARHAAARGSRRVGRSAAGQALEQQALELAVVASIRHRDTPYDDLLMSGITRDQARDQVRDQVTRIIEAWRTAWRRQNTAERRCRI
jgi:hypothetical protein